MPSPFPGMNPYLEQAAVWTGFHNRFITIVSEVLAAKVDPAYFVEIDEHVYIHEWPISAARADAAIVERSARRGNLPSEEGTAALATTTSAIVSYPTVEEERLSFLEVHDRSSRRVVCILELLSRSNKFSGPDREQYLLKRQTILMRKVNFVEIDLLRGGPRMPTSNVPKSDYSVLVSRPERRPFSEYWAIGIRDSLPSIPIPLGEDDADVVLDLQAVLHRVYDAARYESRVYEGQPESALSPADAEWARQFVPAAS